MRIERWTDGRVKKKKKKKKKKNGKGQEFFWAYSRNLFLNIFRSRAGQRDRNADKGSRAGQGKGIEMQTRVVETKLILKEFTQSEQLK
jgi:hypothetical protein